MILSQLYGQPVTHDVTITRVVDDSRQLQAGDVFVIDHRQGKKFADYVADAFQKGAAAVVVSEGGPDLLPADLKNKVLAHPRPGLLMARWAHQQYPKQPEFLAGVTGTNGKTSVAWFFRELAMAAGKQAASIGTLGVYHNQTKLRETGYTSPAPAVLYETLNSLAEAGVTHACMEVSSHALSFGRADMCTFKAVGLTNITQDHLDFHGDMDNYMAAKGRLFAELLPDDGLAVIVANRPENAPMLAMAKMRGTPLLTVGSSQAELLVKVAEATATGLDLDIRMNNVNERIHVPVMGSFQGENIAVAMGLAMGCGLKLDALLKALPTLHSVPGRMERVGTPDANKPTVVIDYAHTPDALQTVLKALRPQVQGKLWVVFGCGGDRDRTKRPIMGKIATTLADHTIITDDNPRSEDPAAIRAEIAAASPGAQNIGDRTEAIFHAIHNAQPGDVVLVTGKGHENGQIVAGKVLPFSDFDVAAKALQELAA